MATDTVPPTPSGWAAPRRTAVVARHAAVLLLREPGTVIAYAVMSIVLMTVLRPVYERLGSPDGPAINQQAAGLAVMFTLLALDMAGQTLLSERTWRTWDRLRTSPAGPAAVLLGKALPLTAVFTLQQAVTFGFAAVAFDFDLAAGSWRLTVMVLAWALCVSCCGLALGAWVRTQGQLAAVSDIGALGVTCLSGCLVPLFVLPHWVSDVARFSPGYWASRGFQAAVTGDRGVFLEALGITLAVSLLALGIAALRAPRAVR
ncbi:ABC transporter permease [Kitasatospora sp. NPDC094011]|uniref:ABC transporter permease n=1 Tax=Kitasatospora sp. NPDC094011 TaxID=3364090 RepID=UPI003806B2FB